MPGARFEETRGAVPSVLTRRRFVARLATAAAGLALPGCGDDDPSRYTDEDVASAESVAGRLAALPTEKAWVAVVDGGAAYDPMAERLLAAGIPTFREADRAVRMLGRYCTYIE